MEELMKKKCEEHNVMFGTLTDNEKEKLRQEIELEQQGKMVIDSVLDDIEIRIRKFNSPEQTHSDSN